MKFVTILLFLSSFYLCQAEDSMTLDDLIKIVEPLASDCEPKPEREHLEEFLLLTEDAQMPTKCLRHCLLQQFDMIDGSKMVEDKTVEMLRMLFNDPEDKLKEIVVICNKETTEVMEKCENAHAHAMCYKRELPGHGFEIPEIPK